MNVDESLPDSRVDMVGTNSDSSTAFDLDNPTVLVVDVGFRLNATGELSWIYAIAEPKPAALLK